MGIEHSSQGKQTKFGTAARSGSMRPANVQMRDCPACHATIACNGDEERYRNPAPGGLAVCPGCGAILSVGTGSDWTFGIFSEDDFLRLPSAVMQELSRDRRMILDRIALKEGHTRGSNMLDAFPPEIATPKLGVATAKINPLLEQIIGVCREHDIAFTATFEVGPASVISCGMVSGALLNLQLAHEIAAGRCVVSVADGGKYTVQHIDGKDIR